MKVKAKVGFIHEGVVRKKGEIFDALGYAFNWLKQQGWVEEVGADYPYDGLKAEPNDGLVVSEGLPPLDEPKKGKKSV